MTEQHPDAELLADLIDSWAEAAMKKQLSGVGYAREIAKKTLEWAAPVFRQQGADAELEGCVEYLKSTIPLAYIRELRAARRPKPPSEAEMALDALGPEPLPEPGPTGDTMLNAGAIEQHRLVRRALERLKALEEVQ